MSSGRLPCFQRREKARGRSVRMRICFIGAGALGSTIGGTLARGGAEGWLIDPFQAHVDAINASGLRLLEGGAETVVKVAACTSATQVGVEADLVIVLVKSYPTRMPSVRRRRSSGRRRS